MIFLSNVLAPSKTYTVRNWVYLQVGADRPGTLTINLQRSNRFGAKLESEAYGVEEDTEALLYGSRVFHLCKLSDGEVYEVYLGRDDRCTCKAGQVGLRCKHTEAMRSLMATGSLDGGHDADAMATAHGPALPVIG